MLYKWSVYNLFVIGCMRIQPAYNMIYVRWLFMSEGSTHNALYALIFKGQ